MIIKLNQIASRNPNPCLNRSILNLNLNPKHIIFSLTLCSLPHHPDVHLQVAADSA